MKGLELCEQYYNEIGRPALEKNCPDLISKMAAGLAGDGSDCFGFDDEISRDHDWGPGFCIWLDRETLQTSGNRVQSIYNDLPKSFLGFDSRYTSKWGAGRVGVLEIGAFYKRYIGSSEVPQSLRQWLFIPEHALATAVNGRVFNDPLGQFTAVRKVLLKGYPEDVRIKKIAARCMAAGQAGQYNFPRCVKRNDPVSSGMAEMKFIEAALSLIFLLNNQYVPFYKWAHRAVEKLPIIGRETHDRVLSLMKTNDTHKKTEIIESTSSAIIETLWELGLSDQKSDFLPDHGPDVQNRIRDTQLRGFSVMLG